MMAKSTLSPIERFFKYITVSDNGCWVWQGGLVGAGYGKFFVDGRTLRAHRWAYSYFIGEIPDGLLVLHECDNPPCCNPDHLFLGTQLMNRQDAMRKERVAVGNKHRSITHPETLVRGEDVLTAILTENDVREIRHKWDAEHCKQVEIAREYGVSKSIISRVISRKTWKHVR